MKKTKKAHKRYALVGTGSRSLMYSQALLKTYKGTGTLAAICDSNSRRMAYYNDFFRTEFHSGPVPAYAAADFEKMVKKEKVDTVIVTTMDRTHHHYIVRAMDLGCDVITEKPMTTDVAKCREILDAVERTGQSLRVTFNYRYALARTKVKELLQAGTIGDVKSVHFEWLLDTIHGADYFRRWHRDKRNSGGLMVHKATHHFDLVNWWLGSSPETVFGFGNLAFYGRVNAEQRGEAHSYLRGTSPEAQGDPFALDMSRDPNLKGLYLDAEKEDAYLRDQNVFGDGINIEDTMNLVVRYRSGAQLSYSLTTYAPWEGYRVAFTGTTGRIELEELERSYISAGSGAIGASESHSQKITVFPQWKKPYAVEIPKAVGGHGGGDNLLLEDLFAPRKKPDPYGRFAGHLDGARSILTGIAANRAFATGLPVRVDDLLRLP
ncbi:MAG TPA: Gfo/Idh/MocA family oxidoreductase [Candidatus Methylacidiphilales bacterium]